MHRPAEPADCPFCRALRRGIAVAWNAGASAIPDAHPLHLGHTLVVPRRHATDLFELAPGEQAAVWALVAEVKEHVARVHAPDGFDVGLNVGAAAGQTVAHAHVHVIPRHTGDVPDPRGGVRWVVPARAAYWGPRT